MKLSQYLKHQRLYEAFFAFGLITLVTLTNGTTEIIESMRNPGGEVHTRLIWLDEVTSGLVIFILIYPLSRSIEYLHTHPRSLKQFVGYYLLFFLTFTTCHITGMMALRVASYAAIGTTYSIDFSWQMQFIYEARKDFLTFLVIVSIGPAYTFILDRLQGEANFLSDEPQTFRKRFLVKMLQKEFLVDIDDVLWIQSARNYVLLHCVNRSFPMRSTMQSLTDELDPAQFQRVHRTAFVNMAQIESLVETTSSDYHLKLIDGSEIPVSRTYINQLRASLV